MILLDTNILVRFADVGDPNNRVIKSVLAHLFMNNNALIVFPQNIYEFWAAATRPIQSNGLGFTEEESRAWIKQVKSLFRFVNGSPYLYSEWENIVNTYQCKGRVSFDARLVANMYACNVKKILTLNPTDFTRFAGIEILEPQHIYSLMQK